MGLASLGALKAKPRATSTHLKGALNVAWNIQGPVPGHPVSRCHWFVGTCSRPDGGWYETNCPQTLASTWLYLHLQLLGNEWVCKSGKVGLCRELALLRVSSSWVVDSLSCGSFDLGLYSLLPGRRAFHMSIVSKVPLCAWALGSGA